MRYPKLLNGRDTMKTEKNRKGRNVWVLLILPPIVFLILLVGASLYFGVVTQGDADAIAEAVPRSIPVILLLVQIVLLVMLLVVLRVERLKFADIGWQLQEGQKLWVEILIGSGMGTALGALYPYVLAPLVEMLQRVAGDYVPPGEIIPTLGGYLVPFFVANVVLAPFVEESIYRGYAITRLRERYGKGLGILITCIFFGLLHWAGGFWYMVLTGGFLGAILAGLFVWRRNIVVPFALHLVLNILEFVFVLQGV